MDTQKMALKDLRAHPLQQEFYGDHSDADDQALAADLRQRGQLAPIVVMPTGNAAGLPGGTILDGHRRARLLATTGQSEAIVEIRDDLKGASAATVEQEFLKYNLLRRQMHPIDKARAVKRLHELEKGKPRWGNDDAEARDRVGKAIGMSGRNLSRYWALLETPLAVQQAVRDKKLALVMGARVAALPKARQQQLATEIIGLAKPADVAAIVARNFAATGEGVYYHMNIGNAVSAFVTMLKRTLPGLVGRVDEITPRMCGEHAQTLADAGKLLSHMSSLAQEYEQEE